MSAYFGGYNEFVFDGNKLLCYMSDYPMKPLTPNHIIEVHDDADWEALLAFCNKLKWEAEYDDPNTLDGTQWELEFEFLNTKFRTYGSNAYPRGFNTFLRKLKKVLSKHQIVLDM
ncbi:MAG: hypothetical protein IPI46_14110 [Bacteroidetes bacterium]|nr:hypothetical protein [Bacteroidota bacterium]